ncbi:hypothetical protein B0H10DRAFT_1972487 [Mycena sp. CBHHK59/15]|nr:hypothetical protein B0H10DRAFT_1972487 [Mycena sp. CBHHK59/15]
MVDLYQGQCTLNSVIELPLHVSQSDCGDSHTRRARCNAGWCAVPCFKSPALHQKVGIQTQIVELVAIIISDDVLNRWLTAGRKNVPIVVDAAVAETEQAGWRVAKLRPNKTHIQCEWLPLYAREMPGCECKWGTEDEQRTLPMANLAERRINVEIRGTHSSTSSMEGEDVARVIRRWQIR